MKAGAIAAVAGAVIAGSTLVGATPRARRRRRDRDDVITTVVGGGASTVLNNVASTAASLGSPLSAVIDAHGNVVYADQDNNLIQVAAASTGTFYGVAMTAGRIFTVVGDPTGTVDDSGPQLKAVLSDPNGVAVDAAGDIAITDTDNSVILFDPAANGTYFGQPMTAHVVYPIAGDADPTAAVSDFAFNAGLQSPDGIAFDAQGDVVVADTGNDIIRLIPRAAHSAFGQSLLPFYIYTIAGNTDYGYTGNGGPATAAELQLDSFNGVAVDPRGDVVFSDVDNNVVRVVAASSGSYLGRAVTAGDIYTVAGTTKAGYKGAAKPALKAWLDTPQGVAVDAAGNLFIGDSGNNMIRFVSNATGTYDGMSVKTGDIYTVAGNGAAGYAGNGGRATAASSTPRPMSASDLREGWSSPTTGTTSCAWSRPAGRRRPCLWSGGHRAHDRGPEGHHQGRQPGETTAVISVRVGASFIVKSARKIIAFSPAGSVGTVAVAVHATTGVSAATATDSYTIPVGGQEAPPPVLSGRPAPPAHLGPRLLPSGAPRTGAATGGGGEELPRSW